MGLCFSQLEELEKVILYDLYWVLLLMLTIGQVQLLQQESLMLRLYLYIVRHLQ